MNTHASDTPAYQSESPSPRVARLLVLGELTASIVHEVNQPLTAISAQSSACLKWLSAEPPNLAEARQSLRAILEGVRRASAILERVRRLLLPGPRENHEPCEVDEVVENVLPIAHAQFERKRVDLSTELQATGVHVRIDPVELQQVVLNLLINAAEACETCSAERRRVTLRSAVERDGARSRWVVCVEDAGAGLADTDRPRLFEALYTTKTHGLGMGLAICRSIIERHSGQLWASDNPEHGASFWFALPVSTVPSPISSPRRRRPHGG